MDHNFPKTGHKWILTGKKLTLMVFDLSATVFSFYLALILRFDNNIPNDYLVRFVERWYLLPIVAFPLFIVIGFYNQIWRFASISQYLLLAIGCFLQTLTFAIVNLMLVSRFPNSSYFIHLILLFIFVISIRIVYRIHRNHTHVHLPLVSTIGRSYRQKTIPGQVRVLIVGAGAAGGQIIREMQTTVQKREPIVIVDDNPKNHKQQIMGVPVLGDRNDIPTLVEHYRIDEIVVAIPSAPRSTIREIIEIGSKTGKPMKIIPFLTNLINGDVMIGQMKTVEIDDLLGREEIVLKTDEIAQYLTGQTILVTGGGGSIGSELCRQIARYYPSRLIIFDIYENNAYELQQEFRSTLHVDTEIQVLIGSVRDVPCLQQVFEQWHPSVVFHAAAHKHVPLMEDSPQEAVKNNIYGTHNVAEIAGRFQVKNMVLISTDKAVNPTNVMGASKRFTELIMQAMNLKFPKTCYSAVRFGNVLGSNGSVIPLFRKQIERDKVVTVTHPEITRYFMTIPEAARLVIQCGAFAKGGEIFVLDMGTPVKIVDLARDLIRLSGLEPDVDVPIRFTGLRPGEKMYEELYYGVETIDQTRHEKIFILQQNQDFTALQEETQKLKQIIRWQNERFDQFVDELLESLNPEFEGRSQESTNVSSIRVGIFSETSD